MTFLPHARQTASFNDLGLGFQRLSTWIPPKQMQKLGMQHQLDQVCRRHAATCGGGGGGGGCPYTLNPKTTLFPSGLGGECQKRICLHNLISLAG